MPRTYASSASSSGGLSKFARTATLVVAASNSKDTTDADYICTGTADNVIINSAITALPASGGKIILLDGTYNLAATIDVTVPYTSIQGMGWNTILSVNNATNIYAITYNPAGGVRMDGCSISDMKILCNGANQTTAGGGIYAFGAAFNEFKGIYFDSPWQNGLYLYTDNLGGYGHHSIIEHCTFLNGQNTNGGDGRGLLLQNSDENVVIGCIFQDNGRAAAAEPNHAFDMAGLNTFIGNQFVSGQTGLKFNSSNSRAIGNVFDGCQNEQMRINGNRNQVIGNRFYNIGYNGSSANQDGLWIDNVSYNLIQGNMFVPYTNTTYARSAINLSSGPATYNDVSQNLITLDGAGTATWATSAIIVGGAGNKIKNNMGSSNRTFLTITQSATPVINTDNLDVASITGLAQAITSMTTSLTGTPNNGNLLEIRITDNGTARAITWGTSFESTTVTLPTTTVISTMLRIGLEWNATASKWDCIAVA